MATVMACTSPINDDDYFYYYFILLALFGSTPYIMLFQGRILALDSDDHDLRRNRPKKTAESHASSSMNVHEIFLATIFLKIHV